MTDKLKCPKCGSEDITEIVYGQLTGDSETVKKMAEGKVKLGGMCKIAGKSPTKRCNNCGFGWDDVNQNFCM